MAYSFTTPPTGFGPGSQPSEEEGEDLNYLAMPSGMRTFEPHFPLVDDPEKIRPATDALRALAAAAASWSAQRGNLRFDLPTLDAQNAKVFADALGEGEVAMQADTLPRIEAQESVFAGVWRIRSLGEDMREHIEIGAVPSIALVSAPATPPSPPMPAPGVVNGPFLLAEITEQIAKRRRGDPPHVVNLTLMPHTPEDLDYLAAALGAGLVRFLSRGYGNCRIDGTGYPDVWRVRYYNSQDALILDTIEVSDIPEVACAAAEDIRDSATRIAEVAEAIA